MAIEFESLNITAITKEKWNEIIKQVKDEAPEDFKQLLITLTKQDLISFHHTLGRHIRNAHGLWELGHEPVIEDGIDVSKNHPDNISMRIIEAIWQDYLDEDAAAKNITGLL